MFFFPSHSLAPFPPRPYTIPNTFPSLASFDSPSLAPFLAPLHLFLPTVTLSFLHYFHIFTFLFSRFLLLSSLFPPSSVFFLLLFLLIILYYLVFLSFLLKLLLQLFTSMFFVFFPRHTRRYSWHPSPASCVVKPVCGETGNRTSIHMINSPTQITAVAAVVAGNSVYTFSSSHHPEHLSSPPSASLLLLRYHHDPALLITTVHHYHSSPSLFLSFSRASPQRLINP